MSEEGFVPVEFDGFVVWASSEHVRIGSRGVGSDVLKPRSFWFDRSPVLAGLFVAKFHDLTDDLEETDDQEGNEVDFHTGPFTFPENFTLLPPDPESSGDFYVGSLFLPRYVYSFTLMLRSDDVDPRVVAQELSKMVRIVVTPD